jgi:hypothetical protein
MSERTYCDRHHVLDWILGGLTDLDKSRLPGGHRVHIFTRRAGQRCRERRQTDGDDHRCRHAADGGLVVGFE